MIHDALDSVDEPLTLAAAGTTLASPLAEVQAQPVADAAADIPVAATVAAAAPVAMAMPAAPTALATATLTSPAASPLGTMASSAHSTLPMLGGLLLVVGLILALGKLVKRVQNARSGTGPALSIKGGVQVGPKERVVWMQAGDTHMLLGVSPGRVQTLHVFDVAPDVQTAAVAMAAATTPAAEKAMAEAPASRDFSDRLKALLEHARAKGMDVEHVSAPAAATPRIAPSTFSFRA